MCFLGVSCEAWEDGNCRKEVRRWLSAIFLPGAPDLVVEILSESTRRLDEGPKLRNYDRYGVREYWMVNLHWRSVVLYRRTEQGLVRIAELHAKAGDVLTTPLLPGLEIDLSALFVLPGQGFSQI